MKKIFCTAAACALMLTSFASCGNDSSSKNSSGSGFEGKWECSELSFSGMSLTEIPFVGIPVSAAFQLELKDDGTFDVTSGIVGEVDGFSSDDMSGEWEKVDDKTIKIKRPEDATESSSEDEEGGDGMLDNINEIELKLDGDTLSASYEEGGQTAGLKFKRVDEFSTFVPTSMNIEDMSIDIEGLSDALQNASSSDED